MRKVVYIIDEKEYFSKLYSRTDKLDDILSGIPPFRCVYTLIGEKHEERYILEDPDGNKLDINSLNAYQTGVVLADCGRHFQRKLLESGRAMPIGCIGIKEEKC